MIKIVITRPEKKVENEFERCCDALNRGFILHLRKPETDLESIITFLSQFSKNERKKIMVHINSKDAFTYFQPLGIMGFSFNKVVRESLSEAFFYDQKKQGYILSTSTHSKNEIESLSFPYDYIFLSPIYDSISKKNYKKKPFNIRKIEHQKVVALGGITPENKDIILSEGYYGYAMLGGFWQ